MRSSVACLICSVLFVGVVFAIPTQQLPKADQQVLTSEVVVPAAVDEAAKATEVKASAPITQVAVQTTVQAVDDGVDSFGPAVTKTEAKTDVVLPTTPTLLATSAELDQSTSQTKCDCECALLCVPPTITYSSVNLPSNQGVQTNKQTIQSKIDANNFASGYCSVPLPSMFVHSNQRLCPGGSNSNIGQKFTITFSEPTGGATWSFKINIDSGYGYVIYLDGVSLGQIDVDVWAGGTNPKTYTKTDVAAGQHVVDIYGGEGCCDGEAGKWEFQRGTAAWQVVSVATLNGACQVSPRITYYSTALTNQGTNDLNRAAIEAAYVAGTTGTGYCTKNLVDLSQHANSHLCAGGTTSNIGQRFQIDFQESGMNSLWKFRVYMDSGWGYSIYFDGIKAGQFVGDVWSGITNPFTFIFPDVDMGPHRVIVYGGEGCCDGEAGKWQVERNNQGFVDLTAANLDTLSRLTDRNAPVSPFGLRTNVRYFSTFLPSNLGSVEANREFIESHALPTSIYGANGFCKKALTDALTKHSNQGLCTGGSNSNIGQRFVIRFIEPAGGVPWSFKINMDSGYGYTVYLDYGILVGKKEGDVWAGGTNPATWTIPSVDFGVHKLVVYGGEGCCDGEAGQWEFSRNSAAFQVVRASDLLTVARNARIFYFSTLLPSNQGSPLDNQFYIENKFQNKQNNGAGYCSWKGDSFASHSNQGMCPGGSNSNIGQRFEIFFYENENGGVKWDFRVYMDSGYGHVSFFDGEFLDQRVGDVWDGSTNPATYTIPSVGQGFHRFVVYGGEGCCDGKAGDWTFSRKGAAYKALTVANLNAAS